MERSPVVEGNISRLGVTAQGGTLGFFWMDSGRFTTLFVSEFEYSLYPQARKTLLEGFSSICPQAANEIISLEKLYGPLVRSRVFEFHGADEVSSSNVCELLRWIGYLEFANLVRLFRWYFLEKPNAQVDRYEVMVTFIYPVDISLLGKGMATSAFLSGDLLSRVPPVEEVRKRPPLFSKSVSGYNYFEAVWSCVKMICCTWCLEDVPNSVGTKVLRLREELRGKQGFNASSERDLSICLLSDCSLISANTGKDVSTPALVEKVKDVLVSSKQLSFSRPFEELSWADEVDLKSLTVKKAQPVVVSGSKEKGKTTKKNGKTKKSAGSRRAGGAPRGNPGPS